MNLIRLALVALLLAILLACASPVSPGGRGTSLGYGVAGTFVDSGPVERQIADYQSVGMMWVRMPVQWNEVQKAQGGPFDWSSYDQLMASLAQRNMRVIAVLSGTPSWARGPDCDGTGRWELACPPVDVDGFATFAAAAAARYAPDGVVWEVWNEPNLLAFWRPAPDPVAYAGLLASTYNAIKRSDPAGTVISAGLSLALDPDSSIEPIAFLQALYGAGAGAHLDGVGWHPYLAHEPKAEVELPGTPHPTSGWYLMYGTSPSVRSVMLANGDAAKKVWVTEFGVNTDVAGYLAADENQQAAITGTAVRLWNTYDWAAALCFYTYRDVAPYGATDNPEAYFGLWRVDGSPKPAVEVLRSSILLGGRG